MQQRPRVVGAHERRKLAVSAHEKRIGTRLKRVAVRRRETHEPAKRRPAIVVTVFQTEENVGGVFYACSKERLVDIRERIRITMTGSPLKPDVFSREAVVKRTELEWITSDHHVSITLRRW